jgi:hypothetical protein
MWIPYVMDRFSTAVGHLALGEGSLSERLTRASGNLMLIRPEDLPGLLRKDFGTLKQLLTRTEVCGDKARVLENVAVLSPVQVTQVAGTILKLYGEILKRDPLHEFHDRPKP